MEVERELLLKRLQKASVGLSRKEVQEQSNCFVFANGTITTFNGDIMAVVKSPLDIEAIVTADDLIKLLSKFPDEKIKIIKKEKELIIKGKKKKAGITCFAENLLQVDNVPTPKKWGKLSADTVDMMKQAARCCGKDDQQYIATCVHVTPDLVESCDNFRLFRATMKTGFTKEILIPASFVTTISKFKLEKVSVRKGWTFFESKNGHMFALRSSHEEYHDSVDKLLEMEDAHEIKLPNNLGEIVGRAEVMKDDELDPQITLSISEDKLKITSRKDTGWYRETKRIKYSGEPFEFIINPQFLMDMMKKTRKVFVNSERMKIEDKDIQFVTCLVRQQEEYVSEDDIPF